MAGKGSKHANEAFTLFIALGIIWTGSAPTPALAAEHRTRSCATGPVSTGEGNAAAGRSVVRGSCRDARSNRLDARAVSAKAARSPARKKKRRRRRGPVLQTPQSFAPAPSSASAPSSSTESSSAASGSKPTASCRLDDPAALADLQLSGCSGTAVSDTGANSDPIPFWGAIDCEYKSRHQVIGSGGDSRPAGTGASQGDTSYRRMTVVDGDDFYGERCELGFNNWSGPTTLYHEGERRVTFISLRVPHVDGSLWKTVMQMKQAQGYRNPILSPVLEMQAFGGKWRVQNSWNNVWSAPAQSNTWTRFAFDITYSQNPAVGSIKVYVDLNGDGDASDSGEQSPRVPAATLRAETPGTGYSDYEVGESIPNHLRAGIYHHPDYSCSSGCSVDVDNVQVVGVAQSTSVPVAAEIAEKATDMGGSGEEISAPVEQPAPDDSPPAAQPPPPAEDEGQVGQTDETPGGEEPEPLSVPTDVANDLVRNLRETTEQTTTDLGITGGG